MTTLLTNQNYTQICDDLQTASSYYSEIGGYDNCQISETSIDELISRALEYDCVIGARAFKYNNEIVVALLTTPFYLKSERDGTKTRIQDELRTNLDYDTITVTFDVEVYRKIRGELTDEMMQNLMMLAKSR